MEDRQRARLADVKRHRNAGAAERALDRLRDDAVEPDVNLMPALLEAAAAYVTVGEAIATLEGVFGTWTEHARV